MFGVVSFCRLVAGVKEKEREREREEALGKIEAVRCRRCFFIEGSDHGVWAQYMHQLWRGDHGEATRNRLGVVLTQVVVSTALSITRV